MHFEKLDSPTQECAQGSQPVPEAETGTGTPAGVGAVPPRGPEMDGGTWGGGGRGARGSGRGGLQQERDCVKGAAGLATVAGVTGEGLMVEPSG